MFPELASNIGQLLIRGGQKVCVAESTTGGLISASLLAVPGASAYFEGGSVVYTPRSRKAFLPLDKANFVDLEPLSEPMALAFARTARVGLGTDWAIAELGAAGPAGSPYGHPAGTSVIGISGPVERAVKISTGMADRAENMRRFTEEALKLFEAVLHAHA